MSILINNMSNSCQEPYFGQHYNNFSSELFATQAGSSENSFIVGGSNETKPIQQKSIPYVIGEKCYEMMQYLLSASKKVMEYVRKTTTFPSASASLIREGCLSNHACLSNQRFLNNQLSSAKEALEQCLSDRNRSEQLKEQRTKDDLYTKSLELNRCRAHVEQAENALPNLAKRFKQCKADSGALSSIVFVTSLSDSIREPKYLRYRLSGLEKEFEQCQSNKTVQERTVMELSQQKANRNRHFSQNQDRLKIKLDKLKNDFDECTFNATRLLQSLPRPIQEYEGCQLNRALISRSLERVNRQAERCQFLNIIDAGEPNRFTEETLGNPIALSDSVMEVSNEIQQCEDDKIVVLDIESKIREHFDECKRSKRHLETSLGELRWESSNVIGVLAGDVLELHKKINQCEAEKEDLKEDLEDSVRSLEEPFYDNQSSNTIQLEIEVAQRELGECEAIKSRINTLR